MIAQSAGGRGAVAGSLRNAGSMNAVLAYLALFTDGAEQACGRHRPAPTQVRRRYERLLERCAGQTSCIQAQVGRAGLEPATGGL
jgi:hypothetical protein